MCACVLVYGLQTALSLAQSVPWVKRNGHRIACASAETVQCLRSQNPYIRTIWIHRLIRIIFVSTRPDVCCITKVLPGVLESYGNAIYFQGVFKHKPYFHSGRERALNFGELGSTARL